MNNDAQVINTFLDICAPSLSPDSMEKITEVLEELISNRHINRSEIHQWALEEK